MERGAKEALIVYHHKAGRADDFCLDNVLGAIVRRLCEESPYVARVRSLQSGVTRHDLVDADLVVAVGGDGTIRQVLSAVAEVKSQTQGKQPPVAIVPVGTGNLFARYLGLFGGGMADPVNHAIDIMLNSEVVAVDLGKMNDTYFCIDAGVGPISNAIVAPKPEQKRRLKMFAYVAPLLQSMRKRPGVFHINADGEEFVVAASGIFITNANEMGIGTRGFAQISDGELDLCILHPKTLRDYWRITARFGGWFLGGVADGNPPYTVRKVRSVNIETRPIPRPPSWWQRILDNWQKLLIGRTPAATDSRQELIAMVDGDRCGFTPMRVEVVPAAVQIKIPPRQDRSFAHDDTVRHSVAPETKIG